MDNNSPLYLAHQSGRNAERFLKKRNFDQAIECHLKATVLLQEAMTLTTFAKSLESLQLQKNYHLTQTDIIRAQKIQYTLRKQLSDLRKKKKMEKKKNPEVDKKEYELQWAIMRAMDEADSLVTQLGEKQVMEPEKENEDESANKSKDGKTVVDELKVVNAQLRSLITKLISEHDTNRREIESLRSKLKLYESQTLPDLAPLELPNFDFSHL